MNDFKFVGVGSGVTSATTAQRAAANRAQMLRQALDSPAVKREIEAKARRVLQDHLTEAFRRGSNGTIRIRL